MTTATDFKFDNQTSLANIKKGGTFYLGHCLKVPLIKSEYSRKDGAWLCKPVKGIEPNFLLLSEQVVWRL